MYPLLFKVPFRYRECGQRARQDYAGQGGVMWTSVSNNLFVHLTAHQCEVSISGREEYQATSVLGDEELWQVSQYSS